MKILVTGCCGFIGSHLCEKLLNDDHEVHGIDIINDYYNIFQKYENLNLLVKYKNFTFKKENIIDTNIINEIKPDIVINIAAMAGVRYSIEHPNIYMRTNVEGQTNLLKQASKKENNVKLFLYASSSSVYGLNDKVPFKETDPITKSNSPYAASKICTEVVANLYHQLYGLPTVGFRFFTVYGPRGRPDMAPFKFLTRIMNGEKFDKYGTGESYRDYTYVEDIVNGVVNCIKYSDKLDHGGVYNLGNSNPISLNEFIKTCEEVTNKKANFNQLPDQPGDVPKTYANIDKAKKDFNYDPKTKFKEGLSKMYQWLNSVKYHNVFKCNGNTFITYPREDTIKGIINRNSFIRFGDGEFEILKGQGIHFQKASKELTNELEKVINKNNYMRAYFHQNKDKRWSGYCDKAAEIANDNMIYYHDTLIFRSKRNSYIYLPLFRYFKNKNFIVVTSNKSGYGYINRLSKKSNFVICDSNDCFSQYDKLLKECTMYDNSHIVLLSCGPCGKILAHVLIKKGYQVIDIGAGYKHQNGIYNTIKNML